MGVFRKRISSQYWCKCFVTFLQKRTKGYKIFSRIITIFHADATNIQNMMQVCKKTCLNMTECCMTAKKPRKGAIHFERYFQGYYTAERKRLLYTLTGREKQHGSRKMFTPRVGRHCTFIVTGRLGRSERFWWQCPKYERPFFARRASRDNKTDETALCFESVKYTMRKTTAQKYPLALRKCTLSGAAGR